MTSKRTHAFFILFFQINSLPADMPDPTIVDGNFSRNGFENVTLDEWFLHGFECCNIVQTNYSESPVLQELNKVPDIIYSGNINEIQDLMANINKNTELAINGFANPYLSMAYSLIALTMIILGLFLRQYKCRTLRYSMRENSGLLRENEFSGDKIVHTYV